MKTLRTIVMTAVAAALAISAVPAGAAKDVLVIKDPLNDANFLNDQGAGDGSNGDQVTPADGGSVSDLLGVALRNDKKNLYITIQTEAAPPAITNVGYRVRFNPKDGAHCLVVEAFFPGSAAVETAAWATVEDVCAGKDPVEAEVMGTIIAVPRKASKQLGKGQALAKPQAQSFVFSGTNPAVIFAHPDTTKYGKTYKLVK